MYPWQRKNVKVARSNERVLAGTISSGLLMLRIATFFFFVRPSYLPHLPIVELEPDEVAISHRTSVNFAEGLHFVGYDIGTPKHTDDVLPVRLYWQATEEHNRDYLTQLCLRDHEGNTVSCHWGHPANGLYPTRAWDAGYLIRDERALPLPSCLVAGDYELTLSVWPLRNDVASALIDDAEPVQEPLSLGPVTLTPMSQQSFRDVYLCTADGCYAEGEVTLPRIRQTLTLVSYQPDLISQSDDNAVRFVLGDAVAESPAEWLPFQTGGIYRCPNGQAFQTHTFVVDPSIVME